MSDPAREEGLGKYGKNAIVIYLSVLLVVWVLFVDYLMKNSVCLSVCLSVSLSLSIYIYNLRFLIENFADNILHKKGLICLHTIKWFQFVWFGFYGASTIVVYLMPNPFLYK